MWEIHKGRRIIRREDGIIKDCFGRESEGTWAEDKRVQAVQNVQFVQADKADSGSYHRYDFELLEQLEPFEQEIALTPTDETRRLLKVFGVAVTAFEDAVDKEASPEEVRKAEAEVRTRLEEVTVLIERLQARRKS
jgi:hypothetical protein